jgi:hypothetical protein
MRQYLRKHIRNGEVVSRCDVEKFEEEEPLCSAKEKKTSQSRYQLLLNPDIPQMLLATLKAFKAHH